MSRRLILILAIIAILAGLIYAGTRPKPLNVRAHELSTGRVEATVANTRAGTLTACRRARLSLAVGGQIETLPVKEGDQVKVGQLLLELWNDDLEAQLDLAVQQHRAAQARADESCTLAEVSQREAARITRLFGENAVSEGDYDEARGQQQSRQAACIAARANIRVSEAQIAVARAALARTRLEAPFDGIIAEINGELNEFVTPSPVGVATPPAVDLIDNRCVYVEAPIDEVDAPAVRPSQTARIALDAFGKQRFDGRVRRIAPYVLDQEKQSRTVTIEVDFVDPPTGLDLKPGYSADAEILLDVRDDVLRIPTEAVLEGPRVWVITAENTLEARDIQTGLSNWQWTEVTDGLAAGERVLLSVDREGIVAGKDVAIEADSIE